MNKPVLLIAIGLAAAIVIACQPSPRHGPSSASAGEVSITEANGQICIRSDGLPNHTTGQFPNRGNPHTMRRQNIRVCVDANPQKSSQPTEIERGAIETEYDNLIAEMESRIETDEAIANAQEQLQ